MLCCKNEQAMETEKRKEQIACIAELLLQKKLITPGERIRLLEPLRKE